MNEMWTLTLDGAGRTTWEDRYQGHPAYSCRHPPPHLWELGKASQSSPELTLAGYTEVARKANQTKEKQRPGVRRRSSCVNFLGSLSRGTPIQKPASSERQQVRYCEKHGE